LKRMKRLEAQAIDIVVKSLKSESWSIFGSKKSENSASKLG
jgi:phenylpyruvate tautomerase PptA (4-oxalocrotonate tautomerase family)